jgi:hypothetical protein
MVLGYHRDDKLMVAPPALLRVAGERMVDNR